MRTILVSLPSGAGVVRLQDGSLLVTDEVSEGGGTFLSERDLFQPVKSWVDEERSVVGGLIPPGAVSVEVVDDRLTRVVAAVADGAYAALLEEPSDGREPIVCCRDAAGTVIRRPLSGDYPGVPVDDADVPCPACGAIDYEECVPSESWPGGGPGPNATAIRNPIVVCRRCGHQEPKGTFYAAVPIAEEEEDEVTREARIARARASARVHRWYSNMMTLRVLRFPIYAAEGWPAVIGAVSSRGDQLTSLTIVHSDPPDPNPYAGGHPRLEITTSNEDEQLHHELWHARETLQNWLPNDAGSCWPDASEAAITLWLAARERESRATALAAARSAPLMNVDGIPQPFLMLSTPTGHWVALRRHEDLLITIAARDLDPATIVIDPIPDPAERLLGPEPPDAKDWPW